MIRHRRNAEHYIWGEGCDGWRLLDGPDLAVIEERMPAGSAEIRHRHEAARQLFFVIEGRLDIAANERVSTLSPGDALEVPPGCPHQVRNGSDADARFLVISAPSTRGDRQNLP